MIINQWKGRRILEGRKEGREGTDFVTFECVLWTQSSSSTIATLMYQSNYDIFSDDINLLERDCFLVDTSDMTEAVPAIEHLPIRNRNSSLLYIPLEINRLKFLVSIQMISANDCDAHIASHKALHGSIVTARYQAEWPLCLSRIGWTCITFPANRHIPAFRGISAFANVMLRSHIHAFDTGLAKIGVLGNNVKLKDWFILHASVNSAFYN